MKRVNKEIFISHSRRNEVLVKQLTRALDNIGWNAICVELEEIMEMNNPKEYVKKRIRESDACFVFPTEDARSRRVTSSWLVSESSMAELERKPVVIFKEEKDEYGINFPYFNALYVYKSDFFSLDIQDFVQEMESLDQEKFFRTIGGGLLGGLTLGPVGAVIGTILGALSTASEEEGEGTLVICPDCPSEFVYYGESEYFKCPMCHTHMNVIRHKYNFY